MSQIEKVFIDLFAVNDGDMCVRETHGWSLPFRAFNRVFIHAQLSGEHDLLTNQSPPL